MSGFLLVKSLMQGSLMMRSGFTIHMQKILLLV